MANLMRAHRQLFRRPADECFESFEELAAHCREQREACSELGHPADLLMPQVTGSSVQLHLGTDGAYALNHWSFSQFCSLCGVSRDTINALSPETASRALQETKPAGTKPLQILTNDETVRAIHGTQYSRLWNADLLEAVAEAAPGFEPPQTAAGGGTGLYCGEQDTFVFLIDPGGWTEIDNQAFAPGIFVWNSEVGKRSIGVQTFWWQAVCCNHIVWDAVEVVKFSRKHTGNVGDALIEMRRIIEALAAKRDERKDGFSRVIAKAMQETVGNADEATKFLIKNGINRSLIKKAVKQLGDAGKPFTIWTLVDALTQLNQQVRYAGDRTEADIKVSKLLALSA